MVMPQAIPNAPTQQGQAGASMEELPVEELKRLLSEVINKVMLMCKNKGIDFNELIGGAVTPKVAPPVSSTTPPPAM